MRCSSIVSLCVVLVLGEGCCGEKTTAAAPTAAAIPAPMFITELPSEYRAAAEFLKRADIPPLPDGWYSALIVKRGTSGQNVSWAFVTSTGEFKTLNFQSPSDSAHGDALLDVGDHIVFKPWRIYEGVHCLYDFSAFCIVKKRAFTPRPE